MAVTVQRPLTSAVTERDQDALVGSAMANGTTILQCALRQHDVHAAGGTTATICGRKASDHVDGHARSTCHKPITSRCLVAPGASRNAQNQRESFPPDITGVSTAQPMRPSVLRRACDLAGVCGVRLRPMALLFAVLFLRPMSKASSKRWMDAMGVQWPTPEERRRPRLALAPATACPMAGASPLGPDHGVRVGKDAHDRLRIPQEAAAEHGEEARPCRQRGQDRGLHLTAAFSDSSPSFTATIKAVLPHARFPADPCHPVKHSWGPLKKSRLSSRRQGKASGTEQNDAPLIAGANQLWTWRWSLLKKPATSSVEAKQASAALAREEAGFVPRVRSSIRPRGHRFDSSPNDAQAQRTLQQLRQALNAVDDDHLQKMLTCFDDHWDQALRYRRKKGRGKHRRGSNAESGRRLRRRLEKNPDGIRSAATRQPSMQL